MVQFKSITSSCVNAHGMLFASFFCTAAFYVLEDCCYDPTQSALLKAKQVVQHV